MNITLREAIYKRVEGKSKAELRATIDDAIGNAEVTLPGIGVLFELIWSHSSEEVREQLVDTLHVQLAARTVPADAASAVQAAT
ncbi:small acid-soluble spore protein SspI [Cohnella sp. JJ-181]|uniref:small acid-soluble spore protein SspI n=1 Tax=Cohnella rhizoplanae TaxID=2974897 RepID=UPI0022FFAA47|nr:small acid-soluble spore protein SspI [Cohnella sp. JJ-181]CAI6085941.1 Small, acid-soluble spore protein I [Cohnella sp. JJ-181]